ncbi:MAG: hypoxanthine phosphoribosyltransferase [Micromonosporaceae bacterium]|nr:hypoxanthine phosphoribosyltransferase [Micromonosporaceae bacterium]
MKPEHVAGDLAAVLWTEEQIVARLHELAAQIEADYRDEDGTDLDLLLVGVLGGAAMMTADLARALNRHVEISWMGLSSYRAGPGTVGTSGMVRLRKDLDVDIAGRNVLVVDGVIDTGLTASWLLSNLRSRGPASVRFCALFRKPTIAELPDEVRYIGFDAPDGILVGYGLDYGGRYRNLRCAALLAPHVYAGQRVSMDGLSAQPVS